MYFNDCWYKEVCTSECSDSCIRFKEMEFLMNSAGLSKWQQVPLKLVPTNPEDKRAFIRLDEIKKNIVNWVQEGNNLYLCSESAGTSKTSWALKLMLKYFDNIWSGNGFRVRGMFVHVPTLLLNSKNFDNPLSEEYKQNLLTCDLIIWDDIATMKVSDFEYSQLLMYIDHRMIGKKSNIYTSNAVSRNELESKLGARLTSRIFGESETIQFIANDYRKGIQNLEVKK